MRFIKITIEKGHEVMETLERESRKQGVKDGAMVSIIGAVDECCISNMPKSDATQDVAKEYKEPLEFSGTGDIKEYKPHIHCVLSKENNEAIHGHLRWAKVKTWHVEIYIIAN